MRADLALVFSGGATLVVLLLLHTAGLLPGGQGDPFAGVEEVSLPPGERFPAAHLLGAGNRRDGTADRDGNALTAQDEVVRVMITIGMVHF